MGGGGCGSEIFGGHSAKYFGASGGGSEIIGGFVAKYFGPVGGFGSDFVGGFFAEYLRASGRVRQRFVSVDCFQVLWNQWVGLVLASRLVRCSLLRARSRLRRFSAQALVTEIN